MKIKRAQSISCFICPDCTAVHIGFFRDGKMFAEAIPNDIDAVAADFTDKIKEARALAAAKVKH